MSDKKVRIVFDGPPGPVSGRFVEVEDHQTGESIRLGEWEQMGDLWALVIPDPREPKPVDQLTRIANALEMIALQGQAQFEFATREENQKIGDTIDRLREEMLKQ